MDLSHTREQVKEGMTVCVDVVDVQLPLHLRI